MARKSAHKPKHAHSAEYKRFVDAPREVGADELPEAFELAFKRVTGKSSPKPDPATSSQQYEWRPWGGIGGGFGWVGHGHGPIVAFTARNRAKRQVLAALG